MPEGIINFKCCVVNFKCALKQSDPINFQLIWKAGRSYFSLDYGVKHMWNTNNEKNNIIKKNIICMQIISSVNQNMSNFMFLWWSIKNNLIKKNKMNTY